jgi:hypothetical protein
MRPAFTPSVATQRTAVKVTRAQHGGQIPEQEPEPVEPFLPHEAFAYFDFESLLHLTSVSPEANLRAKLVAELPRTATAAEQMTHIMERLGKIKYLKNDFAAQGPQSLHN